MACRPERQALVRACEEPRRVGATVHLAEPAETAARRGNKKRAKNDRADARHLREPVIQDHRVLCLRRRSGRILIAGAVVDSSDAGGYGARQVSLYATILTVGYMVSRCPAKSGSHDPSDADRNDR